jgi:trehalose 6-phosphate phosphatase
VSTYRDTTRVGRLPPAIDALEEILPADDQALALFLDYDGTLTPVVAHPDEAMLSNSMRATLRRLARLCEIAVISGRDLADLRDHIGIDGIWYAGSHGFDIAGPADNPRVYRAGTEYLSVLDAAEEALRAGLSKISGCLVERKHLCLATHYRQVSEDEVAIVRRCVEQAHAAHRKLRLSRGRKMFELQPDIDWDKGKALRWLIQAMGMERRHPVAVYIGDDVTDEDAFRELRSTGVGILVARSDRPTGAGYRLDAPDAVEQFLIRLGEALEKRKTTPRER